MLNTATKGIAEVITQHLTVNIDLSDARLVLQNSGTAIMGQAEAEGENRAVEAVINALDSLKDMSEGELLQIEKARKLDIEEKIYFDIIVTASFCFKLAKLLPSPQIFLESNLFGNFNAHHVSYPEFNWVEFGNNFVNNMDTF